MDSAGISDNLLNVSRAPLCLVLLVACGPSFDESRCPFALHRSQVRNVTVRCGVLHLPERGANEGQTVSVPIVAFKGKDSKQAFVNLSGGPGQSWADLGIDQIDVGSTSAFPMDLVFIEQRGTGLSLPHLGCGSGSEGQTEVEFVEACAQKLVQEGIDVSAYNTQALADDVADMAMLLSYDSLTLFGVSYGTAWAQEIMRRHGALLKGVILDSVLSPITPWFGSAALAVDQAFSRVFAACQRSDLCVDTHADIEQKMLEALSSLARAPLDDIDDDRFFATAFSLLSADPTSVPWFIDQVHRALSSRQLPQAALDIFEAFREDESLNRLAFGQYMSVICGENQHVSVEHSLEQLGAVRQSFIPYLESRARFLSLCQHWPYAKRNEEDRVLVTSDIPTLVLAGAFDPRTAPQWAEQVAAGLPRSAFVLAERGGHNVSANPCVAEVIGRFTVLGELTSKTCDGPEWK